MACQGVFKDAVWADWDLGIRQRDPSILGEWRPKLSAEIEVHKFAQFEFLSQWQKLRDKCQSHGISIRGDIPIYVAHDSADVWAHPGLLRLDEQPGRCYRWDLSAASGHRRWIDRFRASLKLFDLVRLDSLPWR